jgi:hypothetical protein
MVIPGYNVRLQFDRDELARCGGEGGGVGRVQWSKDPGAGQISLWVDPNISVKRPGEGGD